MIFYYRLDKKWNKTGLNYNNHKMTVLQATGSMYTPPQQYTVYCSSHSPARFAGSNITRIESNLGSCSNEQLNTNNPYDQWIKWVEVVRGSDRRVYIDGKHAATLEINIDKRSASIGGYYRRVRDGGTIENTSDYRGGSEAEQDDNWRYFDDVYIDNSLSRVVLTNDSLYESSTINLGKLQESNRIYLFIFDGSNNHNSKGFRLGSSPRRVPGQPKGQVVTADE
jgi:hypothetical protein